MKESVLVCGVRMPRQVVFLDGTALSRPSDQNFQLDHPFSSSVHSGPSVSRPTTEDTPT